MHANCNKLAALVELWSTVVQNIGTKENLVTENLKYALPTPTFFRKHNASVIASQTRVRNRKYYTLAPRYVMFFLPNKHTDDGVLTIFLKISDHFPKISEDSAKLFRGSHERRRTFSEDFQGYLKIAEDYRRLSTKTRRCFDHKPTNLGTIQEKIFIPDKSSILCGYGKCATGVLGLVS